MMRKKLFIIMFVIFCLGCTITGFQTARGGENASETTETKCGANEDICILGYPGLLKTRSVYSGVDTPFSIILRNSVEGQPAENVKVELKNVGPFYIIEGKEYRMEGGVCREYEGVRHPYEERNVFNTPNPQFADDYGELFNTHVLGTMYPDEEVEFLWTIRSPSYQEIGNVAYPHNFEYVISYDYSSGLVQTVYAISEDEYQRQLRTMGSVEETSGIATRSAGALRIRTSTDEPVIISDSGSQFPVKYEVTNQRKGLPTKPALFLLGYPEGLRHVGTFGGLGDDPANETVSQLGYLDVMKAFEYYDKDLENPLEGTVCIHESFECEAWEDDECTSPLNEVLWVGGASECETEDFRAVSLDNIISYVYDEFPDLGVGNKTENLRYVLKWLYPSTLSDEVNHLTYQMQSTDPVNISKLYFFRLKTKYRYSLAGEDDILVVPNPESIPEEEETEVSNIGGNMLPLASTKQPDSCSIDANTDTKSISFSHDNIVLESEIKELYKEDKFLQIISVTNQDDEDKFLGLDVGYSPVSRSIYPVSSVSDDSINEYKKQGDLVGLNKKYYLVELPYEARWSVSDCSDVNIPEYPIPKKWIKDKCFLQLRDSSIQFFNEVFPTGYKVSNTMDASVTYPAYLKRIDYYSNESFKLINEGEDASVMVFLRSPSESNDETDLFIYVWNHDSTNFLVFNYSVSVLNASKSFREVSLNKPGGVNYDLLTPSGLTNTGRTVNSGDSGCNSIIAANNITGDFVGPEKGEVDFRRVKRFYENLDPASENTAGKLIYCQENNDDFEPVLRVEYEINILDSGCDPVKEITRDLYFYNGSSGLSHVYNNIQGVSAHTADDVRVGGIINVCYDSGG